MKKRAVINNFYKAILLTMIFLLVSEPALVAAKPQEISPRQAQINALTSSGDAYVTNTVQVLALGTDLMKLLPAIQQSSLGQLSEQTIIQARQKSLSGAEAAAMALGAVSKLADSTQALGDNLPAAVDPIAVANNGLPQEFKDSLTQDLGVPASSVDVIASAVPNMLQARRDIASNGLSAALTQQLQQAGYSQAEIDQIAAAVASRGLAAMNSTQRLQQFRASRDEWADISTRMLLINIQLMGAQISVRQAQNLAPRPITDDELHALSEDELRLLIHVAHLQELWGTDPNLNTGEGDWWFVEHYAARAADRLDALILDSQNRGLATNLFVIQEMRLLALSARNGDAAYVKNSLDGLSLLLSKLVGNSGFVSQQRKDMNGFSYIVARLMTNENLRTWVDWPLDSEQTTTAQSTARDLLDSTGLMSANQIVGAIEELNEDNNMATLLFVASLPFFDQLEVSLLQASLNILSQLTPENELAWIKAILTGDTDNPVLMIANVILGLIPVIGILPNIAALVTNPSIFVKALSLIAIVGNLGDLLELIPGLQEVGAASFLGDAASNVMKALFESANSAFRAVLDALELGEAFDVILDMLKVIGDRLGNALGEGLEALINAIKDLFEGGAKLWEAFVAFVQRVGTDLLLKLGFDEGSVFVGRLLNLGADISDEALVAADKVGDELAEAGVKLSDEAAEGVGVLAEEANPEQIENFMKEVGKLCGGVGSLSTFKIARPAAQAGSDCINKVTEVLGELDQAAEDGVRKLCQNFSGEELADLVSQYSNDPDRIKGLFQIVGQSNAEWSRSAFAGLERSAEEYGLTTTQHLASSYGDDAVARAYEIFGDSQVQWSQNGLEGLIKGTDTIFDAADLQRIENLRDVPGIDDVTAKFLNGANPTVRGARFELQVADDIGEGEIRQLAVEINGQQGADMVLNSGRIVEAKAYVWSDLRDTPQFIIDNILADDTNQITNRLAQYGSDASIEVVFQGAKPDYAVFPVAQQFIEAYEAFALDGVNLTIRFLP